MSRITSIAAILVAAAASPAQTFTVIGLPDTQNYSESYPQIFADQTQWVADSIDLLDIRYVSHFGDVVQHGDDIGEWANADLAMTTLDIAGIPYGVTAGNHDITASGSAIQPYIPQLFESYFGPQRFVGKPWYRGASPSGMSSYQVFDAHGLQFLALHVECDGALRELEWAQGVLHENRDKPCFFTTHRYLQDAEDYLPFPLPFAIPLSGRYPSVWYGVEGIYADGGIQSQEFFDWFVRRNPNIFMVNCGHFHEEFRQTSSNVEGNAVHEVLADYQDDPNGGNGWLRVMTFDLGNNRIDVQSYSPWLDQTRTAGESQFSLPVTWTDYYDLEPTVVLQEGIAGYTGTQDTWINEDSSGTSYGNSATMIVDDDVTNEFWPWTTDKRGQALIRFDNLVGAPGVGMVPSGATIQRATLTLEFLDDTNAPSDPDFMLHQALVPWNEASTWNSLGNGLQPGEVSSNFVVIPGDNNRNGDGLRYVDVTWIVQNWANGSPNYGFAILPEIISGKDDGITMTSSEYSNKLLRPKLEVTYVSDCGYTGYDLNASPLNVLEIHGLGLPRVGGSMDITTPNAVDGLVLTAVSAAPANGPLFGGQLLIDPFQLLGTWFGPQTIAIPVPDQPTIAGAQFFFQSLQLDLAQPQGFLFSDGLRAELCR